MRTAADLIHAPSPPVAGGDVSRRPSRRTAGAAFLGAALAALTLGALPAGAQRATASVDAGGTYMRYADSLNSSAASLTPALRLDWARATVGASGTVSRFQEGGWSTQGALSASAFTPSAGMLVGELAGSLAGSAHQGGVSTGQGLAVGRVHMMGARRGLWGGVGAGSTWDGEQNRDLLLGEAGAWALLGDATALVSVTPTRVNDSFRYTDAQAAVRVELARFELGATAGLRSGQSIPVFDDAERSWGSASVTAWLTSRLAIVGTAGSYPVDLTQGFPGGRFASLALHLGARERGSGTRNGQLADADGEAAGGATRLETRSVAGGRRTVRIHAPSARAVEISGDFTSWRPVALTRTGEGWWSATLPLSPGTYEMSIRLDGGAWLVPPGLTRISDEFGGAVGLLVIE